MKSSANRSSSKMNSNAKSSNYLENYSSASPEPLSSRLEGEKMMVYETELMQEKYIDELNKVRSQYQKHCTEEHVGQVSGDKPAQSERTTLVEDPDMPSIEYIQVNEDINSIIEFDCRDSKITQLQNTGNIEIIENEAFGPQNENIEAKNLNLQSN